MESVKYYTDQGYKTHQLSELILSSISLVNKTPFCVEFGHSFGTRPGQGWWRNLNIGHKVHEGWDFFVLGSRMKPIPSISKDGEPWEVCPSLWWEQRGCQKCGQGGLHKEFITSGNICDLFKKYNCPEEPEWVVIDLDSIELWVMESMLKKYRPLLIQIEPNLHVEGPGHYLKHSITQQDGPCEPWERYKDKVGGASLKALNAVAYKYDYTLINASPQTDAHFIRNDKIKGLERPSLEDPSTIFSPSAMRRIDKFNSVIRCGNENGRGVDRYQIMIDYDEYLSSGGDVNKSREKARPVCEKYL